jgi:hypothetical protein
MGEIPLKLTPQGKYKDRKKTKNYQVCSGTQTVSRIPQPDP